MPRPLVRPTVIPRLGVTQPGAIPAQNPAAIGATPPAIATAQAPQNVTRQVKTPQGLVGVGYTLRNGKYQPTSIVSNLIFKQPIQKNGINYGTGTFTYSLQGNQIIQKLESFSGNTINAPIPSSGNITSNNATATYKFVLQGNSIEPMLIGASGSLTENLTTPYLQGAGNNVGLGSLTYPLAVKNGQLTYGTPSYASTTVYITTGEEVYNYFTGSFQKIGVTTPYNTSYNAATGQVSLNNAGINAYVGGNLSLNNYTGVVNVGGKTEPVAGNELFQVNLATGSASYQPITLGFIGSGGAISKTISLNQGLTSTTYGLEGFGIPVALSSIGGTQNVNIGGTKVPISFSGPLGVFGFGTSLSSSYSFTSASGSQYSLAINPQTGQVSGTIATPVPPAAPSTNVGDTLGLAAITGMSADTLAPGALSGIQSTNGSSQKPGTTIIASEGGGTYGAVTSVHLFGIKSFPTITLTYSFNVNNSVSNPISTSTSTIGIKLPNSYVQYGPASWVNGASIATKFQNTYENDILSPIAGVASKYITNPMTAVTNKINSVLSPLTGSKNSIVASFVTGFGFGVAQAPEFALGTVYGFASLPVIVTSLASGNFQIPSISGFIHEAITQPGFTAGSIAGPALVTAGLSELTSPAELESATAVSLVKNVGTTSDRLIIDTQGATVDMGEATPAEVSGLTKAAFDLSGTKAGLQAGILLKFSDNTQVLAVLKSEATTYDLGQGAGNSAIGLTRSGIGVANYYKLIPTTEDTAAIGSDTGTALMKLGGGDLTGLDKSFTLQPIKNLQDVGISSAISKTSTSLNAVKASEAQGFRGLPLPADTEGFVTEGASESQLFGKDTIYNIKPSISAGTGDINTQLPANPSDLMSVERTTVNLGMESSRAFRAFTLTKQMPLTQDVASFFGEKAGTPVSLTYGESTIGKGIPLRYVNLEMDTGEATEYGSHGGGNYGGAEYSSGKGEPLQLTGNKGSALEVESSKSPLQLAGRSAEGISPATVSKVADIYASAQPGSTPTLAFSSIYSGGGTATAAIQRIAQPARTQGIGKQLQISRLQGISVTGGRISGIEINKLLTETSNINELKLDPLLSDLYSFKNIEILGGILSTQQGNKLNQNKQQANAQAFGQANMFKQVVSQNEYQPSKQVQQQRQPQVQRELNAPPNMSPPPGLDFSPGDIGDLGRIPQPRIRPQPKPKGRTTPKKPQRFVYISDLAHSILNIRAKGKGKNQFRRLGINRPLL